MPAAAIPTWALITSAVAPAAASAVSGIVGAKMQSGAVRNAAQEQARAADIAAAEQRRASEAAEAFQRQQAQQAWAQQEADRRANYDQWAAREQRLGSIGEMLGYGRRQTPGYVPSVNPHLAPAPPPFQPGTTQHAQWYRDTQMGGPQGGQTQPVPVGAGRTPAAAVNAAPRPMTAQDALLARRYPQGSVGALVLARQRRPAGAGI